MKKKKIWLIPLISLILILIVISTINFTGKDKKDIKTKEFSYTPLLYKICDNDSCVYLLGSIHLGDSRINKVSKTITDAYNESDILAVEVDTNDIQLNLNDFMLKDRKTIEDFISDELINKLMAFQDSHPLFQYDVLKNLKLGYISNYLSTIPYMEMGYTNEGIDMYFLNLAHNSNKEIISLETYEEQLNLLIGYSNDFYIKQIEYAIDHYNELKELSKKLYEAYIKADINELKKLIEEDMESSDTEEERQYINDVYYDRNINMSKRIEEFLEKNQNVFVVVGSAHVISNGGIIDLLSNKYKIELKK